MPSSSGLALHTETAVRGLGMAMAFIFTMSGLTEEDNNAIERLRNFVAIDTTSGAGVSSGEHQNPAPIPISCRHLHLHLHLYLHLHLHPIAIGINRLLCSSC